MCDSMDHLYANVGSINKHFDALRLRSFGRGQYASQFGQTNWNDSLLSRYSVPHTTYRDILRYNQAVNSTTAGAIQQINIGTFTLPQSSLVNNVTSGFLPNINDCQLPPSASTSESAITAHISSSSLKCEKGAKQTKISSFKKATMNMLASSNTKLTLCNTPDGVSRDTDSLSNDTRISEIQKDYLHVKRRLRNNQAAKRSRANRKQREDNVAQHANLLEKLNINLQAQITALKKEVCNLKRIPYDPNYPVRIIDTPFTDNPTTITQTCFTRENGFTEVSYGVQYPSL